MIILIVLALALPAYGEGAPASWGLRGYADIDRYDISHQMVVEGGLHRTFPRGKMVSLGLDATIFKETELYYVFTDDPLGTELIYHEWQIPIHVDLRFTRFRSGEVGEGRYYHAGARMGLDYEQYRGEWRWTPFNLRSFGLGAGYRWNVGTNMNVRLEGKFMLAHRGVLQLALVFGQWEGGEQ